MRPSAIRNWVGFLVLAGIFAWLIYWTGEHIPTWAIAPAAAALAVIYVVSRLVGWPPR